MINIIIILIFILPWLIIPNNNLPDPTRLIKATVYDVGMMAIIAMAVINGIKFEYKNKYLGWIAIALLAGFVFNWYYPLVMGFGYNAGTIEGNLHFILTLMATFCICSVIERNDFVRIAKAIVISTTLVVCFAFLQVIGLDPMKRLANYRYDELRHVCALLDHPDILGNYIAIGLPFFLYLLRPKYIIPLILLGIVLFFVHSSLSIIAAIFSTIVFYALKHRTSKKWKMVLLASVVGLTALCFNPVFNKSGGGFTGRWAAWHEILGRSNNPIFGQGIGIVKSYGVVLGRNNQWIFAHNDYIEMYCAGGVILLFLFTLLVIHSIRNFNYKQDNVLGFAYLSSFISFLIVMFGSFPMEIAPLALGGLIAFIGVEKLSRRIE